MEGLYRKVNKILLFTFISTLFCQEFLDRLIVPIYYQANIATGYDSNIFSYSKRDLEKKEIGSNSLGEIKYFDSDYYRPNFKLIYSPILLDEYETNFVFDFKTKVYRTFSSKNMVSFATKFEIKFGSYHWLKLGYSFSPENYLRRFQDLDVFSDEYFDCTYSRSRGFLSYSVLLTKKTWSRITWEISDYFYNEHFTEFDTRVHEFNWYFSHKWKKNIRYGLNIGMGDGTNISYADGLISTVHNRSFRSGNVKLSRSQYNLEILNIDKIYFSLSTDYRFFLSESINDPLHSGRSHYEYQFYSSITKKINSKVSINGFVKLRKRHTISQFEWVQGLKTFSKFETGFKINFNGIYDIYR